MKLSVKPDTPTVQMAEFATLRWQVKNYDELKEKFAGTDLAVYFDK